MNETRIAVALLHWPVVDKTGKIVATNVTNLDVHDIGRACRTYDVDRYYVVNPLREQLMFVNRLLDFWRSGAGSRYNPMRKTALGQVQMVETLEAAIRDWGMGTQVIGTSARPVEWKKQVGFRELKGRMSAGGSYLLVYGTGFGLAREALDLCHEVLEPISGKGDYRHLSVRSAVSISLDRLLGTW